MTCSSINPSRPTKSGSNFCNSAVPYSTTGTFLRNIHSETAISILAPLNHALTSLTVTASQQKTWPFKTSITSIKELENLSTPKISTEITGYIYLFTNEDNLNSTAEQLRSIETPFNGCHIGFSGMHNFDIMAIRRSAFGLICDCNENSTAVMQDVLKILRASSTREEFIKNLFSVLDTAIKQKNSIFRNIQYHKTLLEDINNPNSWLSNDESFNYIRTLAVEENICLLTLDARNSETFEEISQNLHKKKIPLDTLYLSNISNYILDNETTDKPKFKASVQSLINERTISINCPLLPFKGESYWSPELYMHRYQMHMNTRNVTQKLFVGKEILENLFILKKTETPSKTASTNRVLTPSCLKDLKQKAAELSNNSEQIAAELKKTLCLDGIFRVSSQES